MGYHLGKGDIGAAEESFSTAMLALLFTDPNSAYSIGKILIMMIEALLDAGDGGLALAELLAWGPSCDAKAAQARCLGGSHFRIVIAFDKVTGARAL